MVSQDRHEIYLTIAQYDTAYRDYICSPPRRPVQMSGGSDEPDVSPTPHMRRHRGMPANYVGNQNTGFPDTPVRQQQNTFQPGPSYPATPEQPRLGPQLFDRGDRPSTIAPNKGFLRMKTYGPVLLGDHEHIGQMCMAIAALSLQALGRPTSPVF